MIMNELAPQWNYFYPLGFIIRTCFIYMSMRFINNHIISCGKYVRSSTYKILIFLIYTLSM